MHDRFSRTVGVLGDGSLRLPAPFDLQTSAALAAHTVGGPNAEIAYAAARQRTRTRFQVQIVEVVDESDVPGREILETTVRDVTELVIVLDGLIQELNESQEGDDHGP